MICNASYTSVVKSMTVVTQSTLIALYEKQVVNKVTRNVADDTHMLHGEYNLLEGFELSPAKQLGSGCNLFLC